MAITKLFNSHQFVFDLFLEGKTLLLYSPVIYNSLTKKTLNNIKFFDVSPLKMAFIVKDIPSYLDVKQTSLKSRKIKQYKGYLINLQSYKNVEHYIKENLSKRNQKNLFSKKRKLEQNHKITNKVYFGSIDKKEFEDLFNSFYDLLLKRFQEKKIYNRYLSNWEYLKTLSYNKILEQKASLHVIFDSDKPITITLNFHNTDIVFSHIQAYDTDYSSHNMGDLSMLNNLKWCLTNNITVFDLAIGKTDYKDKWCNFEYDFFYEIYYNSKSLISIIFSKIIFLKFKLLNFLRNRNVVGGLLNFDKILYKLKAIKK